MFRRVALIVLLVAAFAVFLHWNERIGEPPSAPLSLDPVWDEEPLATPLHPLPSPGYSSSDLPEPEPGPEGQIEPQPIPKPEPLSLLEESDDYLLDVLGSRFGEEAIPEWLVRERLAERFVVFINSLDGIPIPLEMRPLVPLPGRPVIDMVDSQPHWSERNFARYRPPAEILESIGPTETASLYIRYYPLLQTAHSELGMETDYFNDRLVEIVDHLLDTRDAEDIEFHLEPYEALYRYADESMEAASAGQKIMWRIGPDHAERVREWLGQFRREIARP